MFPYYNGWTKPKIVQLEFYCVVNKIYCCQIIYTTIGAILQLFLDTNDRIFALKKIMYDISAHINENGKGFFALTMFDNILGKLNIAISGDEILLVETIVLGRLNKHFVINLLQHGIIEYAKMNELKIVTLAEFIKQQKESDILVLKKSL
ncbi:MAG: hypothetical protein ABUT20_41515 [Bacteroidota bacterium]